MQRFETPKLLAPNNRLAKIKPNVKQKGQKSGEKQFSSDHMSSTELNNIGGGPGGPFDDVAPGIPTESAQKAPIAGMTANIGRDTRDGQPSIVNNSDLNAERMDLLAPRKSTDSLSFKPREINIHDVDAEDPLHTK